MDRVQEMNSSSTLGIKLFGATISVKETPPPPQSPPATKHDGDGESHTAAEDKKRPEKVIPCPRCKSMETKFCYFNNYNVNQPRHFCKGCRRYWTAGGSLRNVPVGAAVRRKAKPPPSCRSSAAVEESEMEEGLDHDVASKAAAGEGRKVVDDGGDRHLFPAGKRRRCVLE